MASVLDVNVEQGDRKGRKKPRSRAAPYYCLGFLGQKSMCALALVQAVNPVPVGHVALVRAYLHLHVHTVGILDIYWASWLTCTCHAAAVCLLPLQAGCHKASQKFLDIMQKLPGGKKEKPISENQAANWQLYKQC